MITSPFFMPPTFAGEYLMPFSPITGDSATTKTPFILILIPTVYPLGINLVFFIKSICTVLIGTIPKAFS